jgi:tetratricopeptide (TPR) repeat protein
VPAARPTANLDAYDAYLKGLAAAPGSDPASIRRAIGFYERAVALDSTFLEAWARLARARSFLYSQSTPTSALAAAALQALERARALGPDRPETYSAIRGYSASVLHDNTKAREAAEAAIARAPNDAGMLNALANIDQSLGLWDASIEYGRRGVMLDPRSITPRNTLGTGLLMMRRYDEAAVALDQALDLAPGDLGTVQTRAVVDLARGDLAGARAVIHRAEASAPRAVLVPYFGIYNDLYWALDSAQQDLLLTLPLSAFDGDRLGWGLVLAQTYHLRGEHRLARAYGDTAAAAAAAQLRVVPDDGQRHALRGLALAFAGRKAEAIAEGKRGMELMPTSRDAVAGPYMHLQLVRIYILTGEPNQALDQLEPLLRIPNYITPGWLRIDPNFDPLRGNPRFEKLAAGS